MGEECDTCGGEEKFTGGGGYFIGKSEILENLVID
jgi:hypothetical protein